MNGGLEGNEKQVRKLRIELDSELLDSRSTNPGARKSSAHKPSSHKVFLCYRRRDEAFVSKVRDKLIEEGVPVWMDRSHLRAGARWMRVIQDAIPQSRVVLVFIGPSGLGNFQQREVELAMDLESKGHLIVIPVILPRVQEAKIPPFLSALQYVDFRRGQDSFPQLFEAIQDYLGE